MGETKLCTYCARDGATIKLTSKYNTKSYVFVHQNCESGIKQLIPGIFRLKD